MILDALKTKLYSAQKSKDMFELSVLRYLLSEVKNREIELRVLKQDLNDSEVMGVIKKLIKQHEESIDDYKKGSREDLVEKESKELVKLKEYKSELA